MKKAPKLPASLSSFQGNFSDWVENWKQCRQQWVWGNCPPSLSSLTSFLTSYPFSFIQSPPKPEVLACFHRCRSLITTPTITWVAIHVSILSFKLQLEAQISLKIMQNSCLQKYAVIISCHIYDYFNCPCDSGLCPFHKQNHLFGANIVSHHSGHGGAPHKLWTRKKYVGELENILR